jgi:hypothetical protein
MVLTRPRGARPAETRERPWVELKYKLPRYRPAGIRKACANLPRMLDRFRLAKPCGDFLGSPAEYAAVLERANEKL